MTDLGVTKIAHFSFQAREPARLDPLDLSAVHANYVMVVAMPVRTCLQMPTRELRIITMERGRESL